MEKEFSEDQVRQMMVDSGMAEEIIELAIKNMRLGLIDEEKKEAAVEIFEDITDALYKIGSAKHYATKYFASNLIREKLKSLESHVEELRDQLHNYLNIDREEFVQAIRQKRSQI